MIPPVLYHSTPNDGTDGGFRLNEPDILKCGIFKCGNDHSKLKNPLILSIAFETAVFADSIFSLNFARMLSMTEPTVERAPFNFVEKDDLMVRYVDISKAGNPNAYNRKPFSKKEISILWKCKDSNIYVTVILIMIYSGVRIGELLDLEKKDIHLDERWFYVKESKTEAGIREVPIAEKIVPFFEYWMNRKCDHLICTPDDEPFQYRNYYDSYWIPLMLEFGFGKFVIDETKKEPVYDGHRPHDTRHTCISLLTEKEVDERFIKKIVGHKGQGVTENVYTHIELPTKLDAINLI